MKKKKQKKKKKKKKKMMMMKMRCQSITMKQMFTDNLMPYAAGACVEEDDEK